MADNDDTTRKVMNPIPKDSATINDSKTSIFIIITNFDL